MWSEPDDFGVPANMFGYVPEDFIRALGRIVMLSPLIENLFGHVVAKVGRLDSGDVAGWPAGRRAEEFDKLARKRELDPRVVEVAAEVKDVLGIRNALVHSSWPFHGGGIPRGWRYLPARSAGTGKDGTKSTEIGLEDMRDVIQQMVALHGTIRDLLSTLDVRW